MMYNQKTAILLFSRTTTDEAASKTITKKTKLNFSVINGLQKHTLTEIKKTKLPFFISDENAQKQHSFAQKLKTAADAVFAEGFSRIIIVGNDCPELSALHFLKTDRELIKGNSVIGPDTNGGVYLIGITKELFASLDFEKINWQTSAVCSGIVEQLQSLSTNFYILDKFTDINTYSDIIFLLKKKLAPISFFHWLKNLFLHVRFSFPKSSHENASFSHLTIISRRGPPQC
ncbi:MAG: DUF2064 domain-containing protein [Chitinophagaceae bacterium]|nr:DUF2064 domain-containing protein [Chitinophagaceae bacterium]